MSLERGLGFTRDLVANTDAAALLRHIREWIPAVRPACVLHPLGFCVVLLEKSDHEEWRFHVWPRGARKLTGMPAVIHTHNKVVLSKVLSGEVSNVMYAVAEVTAGGSPIYEVEYLGDKYVSKSTNVLIRTGMRVEPKIISRQLVQTGHSYSIPAHDFHQSIVAELICAATLVCMHSPTPGAIKLIGLDGYPDRIEFQRSQCSAMKAASQIY